MERPDEQRRRVILAISELFLDQELTPSVFASVARVLRTSAFTLDELDVIYEDTALVLHLNTVAPAGAWAGFDADWLIERVDQARRDRGAGVWARIKRRVTTHTTIDDWGQVRKLVVSGRDDDALKKAP